MAKELILTIVIRKERGKYSSWCPELDVASQGDTIEEARKNLQEAVELHVETMIQEGELNQLLANIGLTPNDLQRDILFSESFSGSLEVPLTV